MKKLTKTKIIILACVSVVILLVAAIGIKSENTVATNIVGTIASPIQKGTASVLRTAKNCVKNIANSKKNAEKNKKLEEEIVSLKNELRIVEGYKTENERLSALLELKNEYKEFKSTAAAIIGRDSDDIHSTITIDKGLKDNVKKNSVVIVPEGLVGVVYEVGQNFAKVRTVYDSESSVSAICVRSGDMGIVETSGVLSSNGQCSMNYIDKSAKTVVGDMIETSAVGGIFPKGILIGKVVSIKEDSRSLTLSATLETSVNINNLEVVLVSVE